MAIAFNIHIIYTRESLPSIDYIHNCFYDEDGNRLVNNIQKVIIDFLSREIIFTYFEHDDEYIIANWLKNNFVDNREITYINWDGLDISLERI